MGPGQATVRGKVQSKHLKARKGPRVGNVTVLDRAFWGPVL